MHIYEPLFLASAGVDILAAGVFFAVGLLNIRKAKAASIWLAPLLISLALNFVVQAMAMVSRASETHPPSVRTLMFFAFGGGVLVTTILSAGLNIWGHRQFANPPENAEAQGSLPTPRAF